MHHLRRKVEVVEPALALDGLDDESRRIPRLVRGDARGDLLLVDLAARPHLVRRGVDWRGAAPAVATAPVAAATARRLPAAPAVVRLPLLALLALLTRLLLLTLLLLALLTRLLLLTALATALSAPPAAAATLPAALLLRGFVPG